jgi:2Fe-2S ferredoxin
MSGKIKRPSLRRLARRIAEKAARAPEPTGPAIVHFEGHEPTEHPAGVTLLQAAVKGRVHLPHYCGGNCSCGSCRVLIVQGAGNLSKPQGREEMVLGAGRIKNGERLGCQARLAGPVTVRIPDNFIGD